MFNWVKTFLLLGLLTVVLVLAGGALGGQTGMIIAFGLALLMNMGSYWFSDKIVLAMYRAVPVRPEQHPELHRMIAELAANAGLPMPKVYVIDDDAPNAFATGRSPSHGVVAVTTGILRLMGRNELRGVIGHELAHIQNRDILIGAVAATMAGAITMLAQFAFLFGGSRDDREERGSPLVAILVAILAPLAAMLIQMAVSRSREYGADKRGAEIAGDPQHLAGGLRALMRMHEESALLSSQPAAAHLFIVNPLSAKGVANLFSTHPPLEERIRRLEAMSGRRA